MNRYGIAFCTMLMLSSLAWQASAQDKSPDHGHAGSPDTRTVIRLTLAERDAVLAEMRGFLHSTQQIVSAIAAGNMPLAVEAARRSGFAARAGMPGTLPGKLPMGFRKLGGDTHRKFDHLALDAQQMEDGEHALSQLGVLLGNCVSCHATYRFEVE